MNNVLQTIYANSVAIDYFAEWDYVSLDDDYRMFPS